MGLFVENEDRLKRFLKEAQELCAAERKSIMQRLGVGEWKIFGSHGAMREYNLILDQ